MRALFVIFALAIGSASADPLLVYPRGTGSPGQTFAPVVLRAPLTTSGTPFECGANAVACVTWNGSALVDAKANSWTQNGTVPQVAANASPFVPGTAGAGVFSDANYYSLGSGSDVLDFAGDYTVCLLFALTATPVSTNLLLSDTNRSTAGWEVQVDSSRNVRHIAWDGAAEQAIPTDAATVGPNVFCGGRSGGTIYAKLNGGTTASVAATAVAATSNIAKIGVRDTAGLPASESKIYAVWASSTAWTEASAVSIEKRAAGMIGSFGEPVTCTRASTATYTANALEWTAPANVCRFESAGVKLEPPHTNRFLNSDAPATQTITFATGNQVAWVTGAGNIALAVGTATATGLPCTAIAATPCLFNITGAGTVVATYTATLTFVDIGDGTYKTSAVHTVGAAVSRSADVASTGLLLSTGDGSYCTQETTVTMPTGKSWHPAASQETHFAFGGRAIANTAWFECDATNCYWQVNDAANAQKFITLADGFAAGSAHKIAGCVDNGTLCAYLDGTKSCPAPSGAGTGIIGTMPSTLYVGSDSSGRQTGATYSGVNVSRSSDPVVF